MSSQILEARRIKKLSELKKNCALLLVWPTQLFHSSSATAHHHDLREFPCHQVAHHLLNRKAIHNPCPRFDLSQALVHHWEVIHYALNHLSAPLPRLRPRQCTPFLTTRCLCWLHECTYSFNNSSRVNPWRSSRSEKLLEARGPRMVTTFVDLFTIYVSYLIL